MRFPERQQVAVQRPLGGCHSALAYHEQDLAITRELGDRRGESITLGNMGLVSHALGDYRSALAYYEQNLAIARELGNRQYEQALIIAREVGDRRAEGNTLGNLSIVHHNLGDVQQAIECFGQAIQLFRAIDLKADEALLNWLVGALYGQQGNIARAIELMEIAVDLYRSIGHPNAKPCADYLARARALLVQQQPEQT